MKYTITGIITVFCIAALGGWYVLVQMPDSEAFSWQTNTAKEQRNDTGETTINPRKYIIDLFTELSSVDTLLVEKGFYIVGWVYTDPGKSSDIDFFAQEFVLDRMLSRDDYQAESQRLFNLAQQGWIVPGSMPDIYRTNKTQLAEDLFSRTISGALDVHPSFDILERFNTADDFDTRQAVWETALADILEKDEFSSADLRRLVTISGFDINWELREQTAIQLCKIDRAYCAPAVMSITITGVDINAVDIDMHGRSDVLIDGNTVLVGVYPGESVPITINSTDGKQTSGIMYVLGSVSYQLFQEYDLPVFLVNKQ